MQEQSSSGQQQGSSLEQQRRNHPQHANQGFRQQQNVGSSPQQVHPQTAGQHRSFDMGSMTHALPTANYSYKPHQQHHHQSQQYGPGSPQFLLLGGPGQVPGPVVHYGGQATMLGPHQPYLGQQPNQVQQAQYHRSPGMAVHVPSHGPQNHSYGYYPSPGPPTLNYYYPQPPQSLPPQGQIPQQMASASANYPLTAYSPGQKSQAKTMPNSNQEEIRASQIHSRRMSQGQGEARTSNTVRGPPRKPKQSGHALWVGNLPPQTDLMSLVHHICQQCTGLESVFLIAKSNCAFANFQDEQLCLTAQQSLNDTWFTSVRLVTRLRKNTVEGARGVTIPTGPTASTSALGSVPAPAPVSATALASTAPSTPTTVAATVRSPSRQRQHDTEGGVGTRYVGESEPDDMPSDEEADSRPPKSSSTPASIIVDGSGKAYRKDIAESRIKAAAPASPSAPPESNDRYFILKSLTVEDLELSVRTGIWATQAHNEETLDSSFKASTTCDNVYLIFSANKSGEYFGYARMTSEINQDPAAAIEFAPSALVLSDTDLPKAIPTEAVGRTPQGRIIDDSARGTIFWEAQPDEPQTGDGVDDSGSKPDDSEEGARETGEEDAGGLPAYDAPDDSGSGDASKAWGKPFQLMWLSTTRLPFYRTRGMRNPLNANREVKIARDGTEVDAALGYRLISLFHQSPGGGPIAGGGGGRAMASPEGSGRSSVMGYLPDPRAPY